MTKVLRNILKISHQFSGRKVDEESVNKLEDFLKDKNKNFNEVAEFGSSFSRIFKISVKSDFVSEGDKRTFARAMYKDQEYLERCPEIMMTCYLAFNQDLFSTVLDKGEKYGYNNLFSSMKTVFKESIKNEKINNMDEFDKDFLQDTLLRLK